MSEIKAIPTERVRRSQEHVGAIRAVTPCAHCGSVGKIEFHRPQHKQRPNRRVSVMASKGCAIASIDAEIALCTPLCRSCHIREDDKPGFRPLGRKGSLNLQAKLTEQDALKVRTLYELGWERQSIADLFGVNRETVGAVIRGQAWQHVGGERAHGRRLKVICGTTVRMTRLARGMSLDQLSKATELGKGHLSNIETGKKGNVTVGTLYLIAKALDVEPADLLAGTSKVECDEAIRAFRS